MRLPAVPCSRVTSGVERIGQLERVSSRATLWEFALASLVSQIRTIPDYPKPGIQFRDITTLLLSADGLRTAVEGLAALHREAAIDLVIGIEARGFIFGPAVAIELGAGFVPLRKPGKLPGKTIGQDFSLEYGNDRLELHFDAIKPGQRVLLVDDLIATGGTAVAAVELVRTLGAEVAGVELLVALPELGGVERLEALDCKVHWLCEFDGE